MLDKQIHRLMVVDHDKPIGVVSISDIVASIAGQSTLRRETIGDVMSEAFLICQSKTTVLSIARTMTDIHWRSVLVVDEKGKPQGVVGGKDFLKYMSDGIDENLTVSDVMY